MPINLSPLVLHGRSILIPMSKLSIIKYTEWERLMYGCLMSLGGSWIVTGKETEPQDCGDLASAQVIQSYLLCCNKAAVMTRSLKPHTLPDKHPLSRNPPQHFVKLPQHSVPTPANSGTFSANSNGPLANSDVFPAAAGASPGLSEPLGPLLHHA
ncbi:hypothetical protein C0989_002365 [Termitomyces sp. Mn162]|nr:hypothetical protein C0989_002365 [Termitomyces sp. Mn162]